MREARRDPFSSSRLMMKLYSIKNLQFKSIDFQEWREKRECKTFKR